ncbi:MAG: alpha-amylase family glycosyl hydrolase [Actinomycetota bacterium]
MSRPAGELLPHHESGDRAALLPHHDGSALHVETAEPALGDVVTLRLRVPHGSPVDGVALRTVDDGEPHEQEATLDRVDSSDSWWRATLRLHHPVQHYRWSIRSGPHLRWVTGRGVVDHDPTDVDDFRISTHGGAPDWARRGVVYQVFPDRFAPGSDGRPRVDLLPEWAEPADWEDPISDVHERAVRQVFGGSFWGLRDRLDHIADLGATVVWTTPFFPARSSHRYDAAAFDRVDPLLGGDEAFAALVAAAHERGLRVIGDLTTNHCGVGHEWFRTARADATSPEAGFFTFHEHPDEYESWLGVRSLPKLDHTDAELRRRLTEGPESVVARWLAPGALDGWRIDVANMTGRLGPLDMNHEVARTVRRTVDATRPDAYLIAEHAHDFTGDVDGGGWHGSMNYAGFTRPVWSWLRDPEADTSFLGTSTTLPRRTGDAVVRSMRAFHAPVPWSVATAHQNQLCSHDTPRWRTVAGSDDATIVGLGLLVSLVGVPCVFAGDEIGVEGGDSDQARVPFPWHRPERWNRRLYDAHRRLLRLRRDTAALADGGLRWVYVGDDALCFLRETPDDRLIVLAARAAHEPIALDATALAARSLEGLVGDDLTPDGELVRLPGDGPAFHLWRLHR